MREHGLSAYRHRGLEDRAARNLRTGPGNDQVKIVPAEGKTISLTDEQLKKINGLLFIKGLCLVAEEKTLLENDNGQVAVSLKGVDSNFNKVSGVPASIFRGVYDVGTADVHLVYLVHNFIG